MMYWDGCASRTILYDVCDSDNNSDNDPDNDGDDCDDSEGDNDDDNCDWDGGGWGMEGCILVCRKRFAM